MSQFEYAWPRELYYLEVWPCWSRCDTVDVGFNTLILAAQKPVFHYQPSDEDVELSALPAPCLPGCCHAPTLMIMDRTSEPVMISTSNSDSMLMEKVTAWKAKDGRYQLPDGVVGHIPQEFHLTHALQFLLMSMLQRVTTLEPSCRSDRRDGELHARLALLDDILVQLLLPRCALLHQRPSLANFQLRLHLQKVPSV